MKLFKFSLHRLLLLFALVGIASSSCHINAMEERALATVPKTILKTAREHPIIASSFLFAGGFYAFKKSIDFYLQQHIAPFNIKIQANLDADNAYRYVFSHGIADSGHRQAKPYWDAGLIPASIVTFDYADSWQGKLRVNYTQTSLGQENEIERLRQVYESTCAHKNTILMGISRGAATALNFAATNPENLKALILESPYDCMESVIAGKLGRFRLSWIPGSQYAGMALASFIFGKYKKDGIRPIDQVAKIRSDLPILIFCLEGDTTVPFSSTRNLYNALKNSGHTNVYLCTLPAGGLHAKVINHPAYRPTFQEVTHAFYRQHGLPHNPELAEQGMPTLARCKPVFAPSELRLAQPFF